MHALELSAEHGREVATAKRFAFGENWARFLDELNDERIRIAEGSLRELTTLSDLKGKRFLDVGSGSGLFSLAAWRLGATVHSFDYDPASVACTRELRRRYSQDVPTWKVEPGSILDQPYLTRLGRWDVVYSWGVLHHTGALWQACENIAKLVAPGGLLVVAIYNDQGPTSAMWLKVKRLYNALPRALRWLVLGPAFLRLWGPTFIRDLLKGQPLRTWRTYSQNSLRGMSPWRDLVDWVGGLPFEVASPGELFSFYRARGFQLVKLRTCSGGLGCNEFAFRAPTRETRAD